MDLNKIIELYQQQKSVNEIAQELGTYPNKVKRALIRAGYEMRSKSEAAKIALESGRRKSPTEGKQRSEETKERISNKVSEAWKDDEYRELKTKQAKDSWESLSEQEQKKRQQQGLRKIREAAEKGSKLEHYLYGELIKTGWRVQFHREHLVGNHKLHIDLYVPECKVAIEIDGIAHQEDVWKKGKLVRTVLTDQQKNGLLLGLGLHVIRLVVKKKTLSQKVKRDALSFLNTTLKSLQVDNSDRKLIIEEIK